LSLNFCYINYPVLQTYLNPDLFHARTDLWEGFPVQWIQFVLDTVNFITHTPSCIFREGPDYLQRITFKSNQLHVIRNFILYQV